MTGRLRRPAALLLALLLVPLSAAVITDVAVAQSASSGENLELCLDSRGEIRGGEIDLLVLLDDSGSLRRTDPAGDRYRALSVLLDGLAVLDLADRPRNIAVASFGERVDVVVPFRPLVRAEVASIVDDVREQVQGQQRYTDFIAGVSRAVDLLADRPVANCRILVWFTDGGHHIVGTPDSVRPDDDRADAAALRETFCSPTGIGPRLREAGINTFALMLEPPPTRPEALEASKDIMQVITGDAAPDFIGSGGAVRLPSEQCEGELGDRIGRILPAALADQLPGLFADLPNEIEGGRPAVEAPCPYVVDEVTSDPLPAGHLIDWLSLTDFSPEGVRTPSLSTLRVLLADGTSLPAAQFLQVDSAAGAVLRVRPQPERRDDLSAGWRVRLDAADELCLRVRPVDLRFRISTGSPGVVPLAPSDLPEALYGDGRLEFRDGPRGSVLSLEAALRTAAVSGRLQVAEGEVFSSDSTLFAAIVIDGAPIVGQDCVALQIPAPGTLNVSGTRISGPEAPLDPLTSSSCEIAPATLGDGGTVVWGPTLAALNSPEFSCRVGEWSAWVDGTQVDADRLALIPGSQPVRVELRSTVAPENEQRDCVGVEIPALALQWQQTAVEIPVSLSLSWLKRSSPLIAAAIATPAVLLVALLSLLLLRLVNDRWMVPPAAAGLWGYEAKGALELDANGRARVAWRSDDAGRAFQVEQDALGPVVGIGREALRLDSTLLERRMPGWLRPLDEPVMALSDDRAAVAAYPPASRGRGTFPLGFREAVLLVADAQRVPTTGDPVPVRLIVIVPRSGDAAVSDVIAGIVQQRIDPLAERLVERLRELTGAGGGERPAERPGPGRVPDGPSPLRSSASRSSSDRPVASVDATPSTAGPTDLPTGRPGGPPPSPQAGPKSSVRDASPGAVPADAPATIPRRRRPPPAPVQAADAPPPSPPAEDAPGVSAPDVSPTDVDPPEGSTD